MVLHSIFKVKKKAIWVIFKDKDNLDVYKLPPQLLKFLTLHLKKEIKFRTQLKTQLLPEFAF